MKSRGNLLVVGGTKENPITQEFPNIFSVSPTVLSSIAQFQRTCWDAYKTKSFGGDEKLADTYLSILNYSAVRAVANCGAMMMPLAYGNWHGLQFSDETRLIFHFVMIGHYRAWVSKDERDHTDMPEILELCRHVGIKSHPQTLRAIVKNAMLEDMMVECDSGNRVAKGIKPQRQMIAMYEASSCLYTAFLAKTWFSPNPKKILNSMMSTVTEDEGTVFYDVAKITKGLIDVFENDGLNFFDASSALPRLT